MVMQRAPVICSACLVGVNCRYDGGSKPIPELIPFLRAGWLIPVCPEQLGGLSTPREPAEVRDGEGTDVLDGTARVITAGGRDVTAAFVRGAEEVAGLARRSGASLAIMKSGSPSCGAAGVTTALLKRCGLRVFDEGAVGMLAAYAGDRRGLRLHRES